MTTENNKNTKTNSIMSNNSKSYFEYQIIGIGILVIIGIYTLFAKITTKEFTLQINPGYGAIKICNQIKNIPEIKNKTLICTYLKIKQKIFKERFIPKLYTITPNTTVRQFISQIFQESYHYLLFPEGLTTQEIIDIIEKDPLTKGHIQGEIKEGSLMPDTYRITDHSDKNLLIERMQEEMSRFLTENWDQRDKTITLKNAQEALIMASMIEKETSVAKERAIIASTFYNRLRKNMRLESDPTTIYSLTKGKGQNKFQRDVLVKDTTIRDNFNTYRKKGLPIEPICNPGREAILAALHPAKTDYLFFVAKGKEHIFAEKFEEHIQNKLKIKRQKRNAKI